MSIEHHTHTKQDEITLNELTPGERGEVVQLLMEGENRRRLMDLGFVPGSVITSLFSSPLGDPTSYQVRGAMIALRTAQAREIVVRCISDEMEQE